MSQMSPRLGEGVTPWLILYGVLHIIFCPLEQFATGRVQMGNLFGLFSKQFSPLRFGKFEEFYGIGGVYVHGVSLARPKPQLGDGKEALGLELFELTLNAAVVFGCSTLTT